MANPAMTPIDVGNGVPPIGGRKNDYCRVNFPKLKFLNIALAPIHVG